jgi:hypothetical protein
VAQVASVAQRPGRLPVVRVRPLLLLALLALAGCASPAPAAVEPTIGPAPRNVHPDDLVGTGARGAVGNLTGWRASCVESWATGAHTFGAPPWVDGKPCLFLPTDAGTLHWTLWNGTGREPSTHLAAAIPAGDGFDWVVLDPAGTLWWLPNGTLEGTRIGAIGPSDRPPALSAVRVGGVVHVAVYGSTQAGGVVATPWLHHAWFTDPTQAASERLRSGFWFDRPTLATDGALVAAYAPSVEQVSLLYTARLGAFEVHPFPGMNILGVAVADGQVYACAGAGGAYLLLHGMRGESGLWLWDADPFATSPLAAVAFSCPVAVGRQGPVAVVDSPAPIGDGPNPLGGSHAFTRTPTGWVQQSLQTSYHSGAALGAASGSVFHVRATGNGTATGNWRDGTEVRAPQGGDTTQPWDKVWGNFAGEFQVVPDPGRLLLLGEAWLNPPTGYPAFPDRGRVTWAVVEPALQSPS